MIVSFIALVLSLAGNAQVTKVSLQASGLTCSMCSNAINKSLKSLGFVDQVRSNIKTSTFEVTFHQDSDIDFYKMKKKVEDAGFFVSKFIATINFTNVQVKGKGPVAIGNKSLLFINIKDQVLNGETSVRIVNKGFLSSKEYKKNPIPSPEEKNVYYAIL